MSIRRVLDQRINNHTQRTAHQKISIQQQRASLKYALYEFIKAQAVYMPTCASLRSSTASAKSDGNGEPEDHDPLANVLPEKAPLLLPSSFKNERLRTKVCPANIIDLERRMRIAQAEDALVDLRRLRRVYQGLSERLRKSVWGVGQKTNTRSRSILDGFRDKITRCKLRYQAAFAALNVLDPGGHWSSYLLELKDAHVSGPGKDEDEELEYRLRQEMAPAQSAAKNGRKRKHNTYVKSWIWTTPVPNQHAFSADEISDVELNDQVRAEWAKTDARATRWAEEVVLLVEEMRRTLVWMEWKACWWLSQPARRTKIPDNLKRSIHASTLR